MQLRDPAIVEVIVAQQFVRHGSDIGRFVEIDAHCAQPGGQETEEAGTRADVGDGCLALPRPRV